MLVPQIAESAFIAKSADVIGNVTIGEDSSVWYHATIRCAHRPIVIGKGTNIQDNAVIHVDKNYAVTIGDYVTVGHSAIVHGCSVGDNTLIGMGAVILNGAKVGKNCIIGAGALITQNVVIPDNSLVIGSPAKVIRRVTEEEVQANLTNAREYIREAKEEKETI
ncbi:MAG: gamma carbonic anhydrase family protein [Lachnospiraceae bacterium]|nr:gamma carbonic anhydrase family protein [Lachnospiraceae bacterium]